MWGLALWHEREQLRAWREKFGSEYTGYHEGRRIRLVWGERTVGHVCFGDTERYGHLKCQRMVVSDWVWLRYKPDVVVQGSGK